MQKRVSPDWDDSADVVIVGFGAAGACAAIEATAAGADVLVLDRFTGGGATAMSGGVVYAGGGTPQQIAAGIPDTPDAMLKYLKLEAGDVVSERTLRGFVDSSVDMIAWLEKQGVPFDASLCPYKTSYPSNKHYLYYSGSESAGGFRDTAPPAARGHRTKGKGTSGKVFFARLAEAATKRARVRAQTFARRLVVEDERVVGVECSQLVGWAAYRHRVYGKYAAKPGLYVPFLRKALNRRVQRLEHRYGKPIRVEARRGVVLAAGGFVANREMMREHAPDYRRGLPLGTVADDGAGIRMGTEAGGVTAHLDRVSAWRFISPPSAFLGSLAVSESGERIGDESRYGAALGHDMVTRHGSRGWLFVDSALVTEVRKQLRSQTVWFHRLQTKFLLGRERVSGSTVDEVARRAGVDPVGLAATVEAHNASSLAGKPDPAGKPAEFVRVLDTPPYSLLDISIKPSLGYPCPMLTLGGLVVDEETGAVRRDDGTAVEGLYAAGRTAVGICSNSYVSGLSLADCVFSGRRAGISASVRRTSAHG
ncbi:FAD-binding protein [Kibdelosporangium phytohabitans]|uniref:23S rRNA methyltransferase n=1 Tax=Kibdelosporangium phytohabitans TaxID=860235 RepID=A0A0N9ICK6_9PSEU|nr:FAD-binding protein [Kibdelosporangium phytohabitans]ALG12701.1 23S rRNA methyltransferase [Kibdelosporangium phytohabitans]MBE1464366.1 3-oxo-5alpha-steroid 4-dehydrogenase [Kibdelosporangium phytohabitans]